ncbi:MAG: hypothetical protein H3C26_16120 [Rhodocyclaceae bacterium]|nr:hypothetical protein [Rhodocyclaceae bacterium]
MFPPEVVEELKKHKSNWDVLSESQKVESLISRVRILVGASEFSADEVELAMDLAVSALTTMRGRVVTAFAGAAARPVCQPGGVCFPVGTSGLVKELPDPLPSRGACSPVEASVLERDGGKRCAE